MTRSSDDENMDVSIDLRDEVIDDDFYKQPTKKHSRHDNRIRNAIGNVYQNYSQPIRNNFINNDEQVHNQDNYPMDFSTERYNNYSHSDYIQSGISNNALIGIIIVTGIVFSVFGGIYGATVFDPVIPHYVEGKYLENAQEYITVEGGNTLTFIGTVLYWAFILFAIGGFLSGIIALVVVLRR